MMIAVWCIMFTIWFVGFFAFAYFELTYKASVRVLLAALAWPVLLAAHQLEEWAYGGDDDL